MKLNEKQKLTAVIAAVVLAVVGIGTLTFFKFQERKELAAQMDDLLKQEKVATDRINRIPGLREERDRLAATVEDYAAILPKDAHVEHDSFVYTIDSFRRDTDVLIKRAEYVNPPAAPAAAPGAPPVKRKKFIRHRYRFELVGTVPHLISFINKIENHTRFLKIDALNIRPLGAPRKGTSFENANPEQELQRADQALKEVDLTISTYTYFKGA